MSSGPEAPATTTSLAGSVDADTIEARSYEPGECVRWNASVGSADSDVVECAEPHLLQVAGRRDLGDVADLGDEYPSEATWDLLFDRECGPIVAAHFGGEIDPFGRWAVGGLRPTEEGWLAGDRDLWCGLVNGDPDGAGNGTGYVPMAGAVDLSAQAVVLPTGQCRAFRPDGLTSPVDCASPHQLEVAGVVAIPDGPAFPGQEAVDASCSAVAEAYLPDRAFSYAAWVYDDRSWAAGTRQANCMVGDPGDVYGWGTRTGSIRG